MTSFNFENIDSISEAVKNQINQIVKVFQEKLADNLIGVYLHGSLALSCFRENTSDLDILVIIKGKLNRQERLSIAKALISIDRKPCPVEVSAIAQKDLVPWNFPTVCQFHYSDYWTERYEKVFSGESSECYVADQEFVDADIASYVTLLLQNGICLYGQRIEEVFPQVPEEDFISSIANDVDDYDFHAYNSRYFTSNILILGRIRSYFDVHRILSKYEGALWTLSYVPEHLKYIIADAILVWYGGKKPVEYKKEELEELRELLVKEIKTKQGERV